MQLNTQGKRYYGLHFYPGVAQYQDGPDGEPYRVYLNEDTLRKMDATFSVKPVFVEHVEEVPSNITDLKKQADGWVVRSFFNDSDGMHWVEFITLSEAADRAIASGWRLSNAYRYTQETGGGLSNGVPYIKEITNGEYDHLAIVKNPRYENSIILTPDAFKKYNQEKLLELKSIANSASSNANTLKPEQGGDMKLSFYKKTKVDNGVDFSDLSVILPKTQKEKTLVQIINEFDALLVKNEELEGVKHMANMDHMVKMNDGSECSVGDLMKKHQMLHDELQSMKKDAMETDMDVKEQPQSVDVEGDKANVDDDKAAEKKALDLAKHEEMEMADKKKQNDLDRAKQKALALKNAPLQAMQQEQETRTLELSSDRVQRGKQRYGS